MHFHFVIGARVLVSAVTYPRYGYRMSDEPGDHFVLLALFGASAVRPRPCGTPFK